jgi:hypothetical protein
MKMWCMRIAFWVFKATNTRSGCGILLVFHYSNSCPKASQCYFVRKFPLVLCLTPANAFTIASLLCLSHMMFAFSFQIKIFYRHLNLHVEIRPYFNFMGSEEIDDTGLCWGNPKERGHSVDLGVEERVVIRWTLE